MRLEGSAPLNGATLGGGRLDGQPRTQGKVTFSTGGDLIRTKLETPARSATVVTRQGWVSKQSWGDTAAADGQYRYCKSNEKFHVFFFRNAYLLQERRHLAPAKDTEAKTRFRR